MLNAVKVENLSFHWPGQRSACVNDLNFAAHAGEKIFIVGKSGSGKSTFLNLLAGILRPQGGSIVLGDTAIHSLGARAMDRFRAQHIGLIFQQFNLVPYLDVQTNIQLAAHFGGVKTVDAKHVSVLLEQLDLDPLLARRRASELSVGQQQRVAVARAVVNNPRLLIADEPTSALDADTQQAFMALLSLVCTGLGTTVIFVSHDARLSSSFDRCVDLQALQGAREISHAA